MDLFIDEPLRQKCLRIARRMVGNNDAEDICQEGCFLALCAQQRGEYRGQGVQEWEGYVCRIMQRLAINLIRERSNRSRVEILPSNANDGSVYLSQMVLSIAVGQALAKLPEDRARLIVMVDVEEASIAEAAEVFNLSVATIKGRLRVARAQLRLALAD